MKILRIRPELLIHSARPEPAVDNEQMSGHKTGRFRCEEYGCAHEFFRSSEALHGRSNQAFLSPGRTGKQSGIEIGWKYARHESIDTHSVSRPFCG